MSLVRAVNRNVHCPAEGRAISPIAWKSVIASIGIWIGSMLLDGSAAVADHSTTLRGLLSGVNAYTWIVLLPTVAGKTSTCRAIALFEMVWVIAVVAAAVWAASAVRGGDTCTSAEVTPSTIAVIASSASTG